MPSPRADFRCDVCNERWELPISAKSCPDPECPGLLTRIWDATGSPKPMRAQFFRVAKLTDHGQHARKPDVSPDYRRAMAANEGVPAFVQQRNVLQDFAPHFSPMSKAVASQLGAAVGRSISTDGAAKGRDPSGQGEVEGPLAITPKVRPAAGSMGDKSSLAMVPKIRTGEV